MKRTLILQREEKHVLSYEDIEKIIKQQYDVENYIPRKNKKSLQHDKKWKKFIT